jgi:hypothetical protein
VRSKSAMREPPKGEWGRTGSTPGVTKRGARCDIGIAQQFPPALESVCVFSTRADVAQLVEQPIRNRQVSGSSPLVGSIPSNYIGFATAFVEL